MARRVLITGASRGIGRAIAIALARRGFELALNYRANREASEEVLRAARDCGAKAELLAFDVANRDECTKALERDVAAHGAYWGVVCNAGICDDAPFVAMTGEAWDRVLRTNLDGFYNVLHPLVMPMVQLRGGGRIVTLSSISGLAGNRGQANYAATKAGIIGATKSLALELAKRNITVNCVAPGLIETDMTAGVRARRSDRTHPDAAFRKARGSRGRGRVPVPGRRFVPHRPGDLGQRRHGVTKHGA
jgi:3-oxoacyl-[acyl-carrier protein] reductase